MKNYNSEGFTPNENYDKVCRIFRVCLVQTDSDLLSKVRCNFRSGFTLIELLTVIIVLAILSAMAVPTFNKAMENAREREATTVLELIYNAQRMYRVDKNYYASNFSEGFLSYIKAPGPIADYYNFAISNPTGNQTSFKATATKKGGTRKNYQIDQTGVLQEIP